MVMNWLPPWIEAMLHELTALPSDGFYIIRNGTLACSFTPQYPKKSIGFLGDPKAAFTLQYIDTLSEDIVRGEKGRDALIKQHSALFLAKARAEAMLQALDCERSEEWGFSNRKPTHKYDLCKKRQDKNPHRADGAITPQYPKELFEFFGDPKAAFTRPLKRATINIVPKSIFVLSIMQSVIAIHDRRSIHGNANSWPKVNSSTRSKERHITCLRQI